MSEENKETWRNKLINRMKFKGKGTQTARRLLNGMTIVSYNNSNNPVTTSHESTIVDRKL